AVSGRAEIPSMRLSIILLHSISALVKVADLLFRLRQILVRRFAVPIKGLFVITLDANPILEHAAHIILPQRIALLRCGTIVGYGSLLIPRHAELMLVHVAQLILSRRKALVRGLRKPEECLTVVLRDADAAKIMVPEGELRLRISRSGGLAKRVEVVVLRRCRRRRLGWRRDRSLRSRCGKQSEHKESCNRGPSSKAHGDLPFANLRK